MTLHDSDVNIHSMTGWSAGHAPPAPAQGRQAVGEGCAAQPRLAPPQVGAPPLLPVVAPRPRDTAKPLIMRPGSEELARFLRLAVARGWQLRTLDTYLTD